MLVNSVNDTSQLQNTLLKLSKEKSYIVNNSNDLMKKAEEGEIVVLRGRPRFILILYSIFLLIIGAMMSVWYFGFSFMDWNTLIIIFSVWFGTGVFFLSVTMSHIIIFHPEGFLTRRFFFIKFTQKWKFLTEPPSAVIDSGPQGGKFYNVVFTGPWGVKRMITSFLEIKDLRKNKDKMNFIGKIARIYHEKSRKS